MMIAALLQTLIVASLQRLYIVHRYNARTVPMTTDQPLLIDLFLDSEHVSLGEGELICILRHVVVEGLNLPGGREEEAECTGRKTNDYYHTEHKRVELFVHVCTVCTSVQWERPCELVVQPSAGHIEAL